MTENSENPTWPMPKFYFSVDWGSQTNISFQEISGLDTEAQIVKYKHGDSPQFSAINMPGLKKYGSITMKKGVFVSDNNFYEWYRKIKMNTIERQNVTIKLLDEAGNPTMTWSLINAWPVKISGTDLKSNENEVAIESIEVSHEGLTIEKA